jgi:sirohydrochlorin cobaltochelatase
MPGSIERDIEAALTGRFHSGQILFQKVNEGFVLCHRDDETHEDLQTFCNAEDAADVAKYDDAGDYRPLKTAPNLRHGWRMELGTWEELKRALDHFYPGRFAVFGAWKTSHLRTTPLRETLDRQSGMYRVAAKISDDQIDNVVGDFCRSDGGCLRTILWKRDQGGTVSSTKLPKEKFDPSYDQAEAPCRPGSATPATVTIPLLCQEPCNLLVAECRKVVKGE